MIDQLKADNCDQYSGIVCVDDRQAPLKYKQKWTNNSQLFVSKV